MPKMSDRVRHLVGLEKLLLKARRRHRECEREFGGADSLQASRYRDLVERISYEIHGTDRGDLEEYLAYVEQTLVGRLVEKVEETKVQMLKAARRIV